VPKSTTLDDLEGPLRAVLQKYVRLSEPTTKILSATTTTQPDDSILKYKVYADIRSGSQDKANISI